MCCSFTGFKFGKNVRTVVTDSAQSQQALMFESFSRLVRAGQAAEEERLFWAEVGDRMRDKLLYDRAMHPVSHAYYNCTHMQHKVFVVT